MLERVLANWPLKLLALVLAFAIWVSVTGETRVVQDFSIPLDIRLSETTVLSSTPPTTVTVRLRGPESLVRRLDPVPMSMRVDLADAGPGEQDVLLTAGDLRGVPRGVEVEFIDPDRLRLVLDDRLRRELPVEPTFLGKPPAGYDFYGAQVMPDTVLVEGPRAEIEPLQFVRTTSIRLDQRSQPFEIRTSAIAQGEHVRVLDPRPLTVRVSVDTTAVERLFDDIPVQVRGRLDAATTPATVRVTIAGPGRILESLAPGNVVAFVSPPEKGSGPVKVRVDFVDVPVEEVSRLTLRMVAPRDVRVAAGAGRGS